MGLNEGVNMSKRHDQARWPLILGLAWLALGIWAIVGVSTWLGIGMCALGVAYLASIAIRSRSAGPPQHA
jgi:hypothetical protein